MRMTLQSKTTITTPSMFNFKGLFLILYKTLTKRGHPYYPPSTQSMNTHQMIFLNMFKAIIKQCAHLMIIRRPKSHWQAACLKYRKTEKQSKSKL